MSWRHIGEVVAGMEAPEPIKPICTGCNKRPDEIDEYIEAATQEDDLTPDQYVKEEEGTYNPENGHFLCTICYVADGMPSSPTGWTAP